MPAIGSGSIDLNSDLGEGVGDDESMLQLVTSANVACGFHAGDPLTIAHTVRAAATRNVRVGAQVSYADREGFGRRAMDVPADRLTADVLSQVGALAALCRRAGTTVSYVKPHGALYNRILDDEIQATAVIAAITAYDEKLPLLTMPNSAAGAVAKTAGVPVVLEGFADRAYTDTGRLVPRSEPGAVIVDVEAAAAHAVELATAGVQSICVHGDTPGAVHVAAAARETFGGGGVPHPGVHMKVLPFGDRAVLCEVDDLPTVHRLRAAILAAGDPDVIDVVPAWRTVLVTTRDEPATNRLAELIPHMSLPPAGQVRGREHVVPVKYDGPDLPVVAEHAGLGVDEVVQRHLAATYTVAFLGFQPGFPYLAGLDPALVTPRRETPRTAVPAGSVGIAGDATGIYPRSSPGGWQVIARTDVVLFDVERDPPAMFEPGDTVRFTR